MGWTYMERPRGITDREFFLREFPKGLGDGRLLDCATKGNTFYAAVRDDSDNVYALVVLIDRFGDPRMSRFNFGYKDMSENEGPVQASCPERILDLLSPTENEHATEWRKRCRASIATAKARPKLTKGDTIRFATPLTFNSGQTEDTFTLVDGRRRHYRMAKSGTLCRLSAKSRWGAFEKVTV